MWKWIIVLCVAMTSHLCAEKNVLAFAGSNRHGSVNEKLVNEAANIARQMNAHVTLISLKHYHMPIYSADEEIKEGMPAKVKEFRHLMIQNEVIFISSPEYNGSVPALLKNAIDWASRSETGTSSRDAFKGKTFVIMGASAGPTGGSRALVHLRAILEAIGGTVITEQVTIPFADKAFDEQGHLKDPILKKQLEQLVQKALS